MNDFKHLSPEELNKMDKQSLIAIIGSLQGQLDGISRQLNFLTEQIALMNQRSFGRKTEKASQISGQMSFSDFADVFNEPEFRKDDSPEPEITEVTISGYTRKKKTGREEKLEGLPARIFEHTLSPEELEEKFPDGYKELPCEVYKRLSIIPQTFLVDEHHVHIYASKSNDGVIVRAKRPADVFRNSLATSSLLAALMTSKYYHHFPLDRQSRDFKAMGVSLDTNTMANWMVKVSEKYLSLIYDEMHKEIFKSKVIHADETPFQVIKDGRAAGSKSYMWVYRNGACDKDRSVVIYDYEPTRKADHPAEFLKDYSGTLVTDGYQVYHTLGRRRRKTLKVGGCWIHSKRKFSELIKAIGTKNADGIIAAEASNRISELSHLDNQWDDLEPSVRLQQRQLVLKPKVDEFFAWAKEQIRSLPAESQTYKGLQYCINQEEYLRVFLDDPDVPMDNNLAEQAIRPFTIGRKNWVNICTPNGAQASAVIYSLVETAKANNLRIYDYLEFLIGELAKHQEDKKLDFIQDLLPWATTIRHKFARPIRLTL